MNKTRILVVEDEIIIAMEIADRLKSMNYDVLRIVANGEMAIKTVKSDDPDLILMDIMIQGDIDGIETATRIHEFSDVPVIYLTANADEATLERAKVSDAFGYLIKPFEEKELNTTIEMVLYKHRMETKLRESEERFKSLVENSSIGIFRLSIANNILHANPTFLKLLGFSTIKEIVGLNFNDFLVDLNDKRIELKDQIDALGKIEKFKAGLKPNNGEPKIISLGGNIVKWQGESLYFDGTIEDITIQYQYEEELVKAKERAEESDKLKTEFLAGMSHEIRTPVNTIMSYLSLLNEQLNSSEDTRYNEIFEAVEIGGLRLTRTIDSILNMAQFQSGTFDVFKTEIDVVNEVIEGLYEEFKFTAKQRGLELRFSNTTESSCINGDKYSLTQLFANLIDNGLKYTRDGFVDIKVFNDEDGMLSVSVEDTGIGISEEFLPTLFKPFTQEEQGYTRKFDGNGLGLALVKRYCELNKAIINVNSGKNVGTKFTVKFSQANKNIENNLIEEFESKAG